MKSKYRIWALLVLAIILVCMLPPVAAPEEVAAKAGPRIENPPPVREPRDLTQIESYIFISEKNIFHPERKEFPVQAPPPPPAAEVKKPIVRPQVILYGVTLAGEYESASISNPGRVLKKGERELQTLRKGESIGDYKLSKILPDRIILETSEDSLEVFLYDPKVAKRRSDIKTENKPAAVTSLGPTPAAAPAAAPRAVPPPASAAAAVPVLPRIGGAEGPKEPAKVVPERPVARPANPASVTPAPAPVPYTGVRGRTRLPRTEPQGTGD